MTWEEYFNLVFKFGNRVKTVGKQTAWERVMLCFDYYCSEVPAGEARSLLRESGRQ